MYALLFLVLLLSWVQKKMWPNGFWHTHTQKHCCWTSVIHGGYAQAQRSHHINLTLPYMFQQKHGHRWSVFLLTNTMIQVQSKHVAGFDPVSYNGHQTMFRICPTNAALGSTQLHQMDTRNCSGFIQPVQLWGWPSSNNEHQIMFRICPTSAALGSTQLHPWVPDHVPALSH